MRFCTPERSNIAYNYGAEELGDPTPDMHVVLNFPKPIDFMKAVFRQSGIEQDTEAFNGTAAGACDYATLEVMDRATKRASPLRPLTKFASTSRSTKKSC